MDYCSRADGMFQGLVAVLRNNLKIPGNYEEFVRTDLMERRKLQERL